MLHDYLSISYAKLALRIVKVTSSKVFLLCKEIKRPNPLDWLVKGIEESPGTELFWQGATPSLSSPLLRFTTEFGMGRSGATAP
jgi:hypothetical protein